jgi:hypothetical protein
MRLSIIALIGTTVAVAAEPVPYSSLPNAFWRGNHGNVLACMSHQIDKDIIRLREAGIQSPDEQIYVDDEPADLPSGSIEVTFADTDANYACVPSGGPDVSLISIEMGEIFTICSKWYPGCEN